MKKLLPIILVALSCGDDGWPEPIKRQNELLRQVNALQDEVEWLRNRQIGLAICLEWPDWTQQQITECVRRWRFK